MSIFFLFLSLISDIFFSSLSISGLPLRFYALLTITFLQYKSILFKIPRNPLFYLLVFSLLYNLIYGIFNDFDSSYFYNLLRGNVASILIFLITYNLIFNIKRIKYFLFFYILLVSISALFCIMQFFGFDLAWDLRTFISTSGNEAVIQSIQNQNRPVGLAFNTTELGYQLATIFPIVNYFFWNINDSLKRFLITNTFNTILIAATFLSNSKSALLAIGITNIRLSNLKNKSFNFIPYVYMGGLFSYVFYQIFTTTKKAAILSSFSKIPMFILGAKYIIRNPFGCGLELNKYADFIKNDPLISEMPESLKYIISRNFPHNHLLNTMIIYGWLGFIIFILYYFFITKFTLEIFFNSNSKEMRIISLSLYGSELGYFVNGMFHNAGQFVLDPMSWYLTGIICSLYIIHKKNKELDYV